MRYFFRAAAPVVIVCAFFLFHALPAQAATNNVDCVTRDLISALNDANSSGQDDTINLSSGCVYTLTDVNNTTGGPNGLPAIANNGTLTIHGNGATITRSSADGTPTFRIFYVASGATLTMDDVTLSNGDLGGTSDGGALYNGGGTVTLVNSILTNNHNAVSGGGIYSIGGDVTLTNSAITDNSTAPDVEDYSYGGGIIVWDGDLTVTGSTISRNSTSAYQANWGLGIYMGIQNIQAPGDNGHLTITDSTIDGNSTTRNGAGGGVFLGYSTNATISGSTISNNKLTSTGTGGAITATGATLTVSNSTISGNTITSPSPAGGAIEAYIATTTLENVTMAGNTAGLYTVGNTVNLKNSIFADTGDECHDIGSTAHYNVYGTILLDSLSGCPSFNSPGTVLTGDPMLSALADNGGSIKTMALQTGSPAIDAATDCTYDFSGSPLTGTVDTDQRGTARPIDGDADSTARCDLGAYEAPVPPTVTVEQATGQTDPTGITTFHFTATFSEPTTDFATGDVTIGGTAGATTAIVTGSGTTYDIAVSGVTTTGTVTASLKASVAHNADGIGFAASTSTDNSVSYVLCSTTVADGDVAGLIAAINCANQTDGDQTITLAANGTYTLTSVDNTDGGLGGNGLPAIVDNGTLTINGNGSTITRSGSNLFRFVYVLNHANLTLNDLAFSNGDISNLAGGAIFATYQSTLTVNRATLSGNHAAVGGALANYGTASLTNVTISGNSGNDGAGLHNEGAMTVSFATISDNTGDGVSTADGTLTLKNSILANNSAKDCLWDGGTIAGLGTNIIEIGTKSTVPGSTSCLNSGTAALTDDPQLGPLQANGGSSLQTMAPAYGSPAIDATSDCTTVDSIALTQDEIKGARPVDGDTTVGALCDLGAYEAEAAPSVTVNQASSQDDPTITSPIHFTVTFSSAVTGFDVADITLGGTAGPTTAVVSGTGPTYDVAVSGMTGSGTVTASLAANAVMTVGGTGNQASTSTDNSVTYNTCPTFPATIADGDVNGLIAAIKCANVTPEDDVINLAANGTYTLMTVNNDYFGKNGLPVIADNGLITINGNGATITRSSAGGTPDFRIFFVDNDYNNDDYSTAPVGLTPTLALNNLTISNGAFTDNGSGYNNGGAIYNQSSLTLDHVTLSDNAVSESAYGGALYTVYSSTTAITDSTITGNKATGGDIGFGAQGGAIYNSAVMTISGTTISGNHADLDGGGIYNYNGKLTVSDSTISGNTADEFGGGIEDYGSLTITGSTLNGNSATRGAAVDAYYGSVALANSTVAGNSGSSALYSSPDGPSIMTLVNATVSGNINGGIEAGYLFYLKNSIIAGNTTADCTIGTYGGVSGDPDSVNLIADSSCAPTGGVTLNGDPLLGSLADNGGPTQTMALLPGSPAIDAATECTYDVDGVDSSSNPLTGDVETDQRGVHRPTDGDFNGHDDCDLGAYEAPQGAGAQINQAVSQDDPTISTQIDFVVQFSSPVTGFDSADDLDLSDSTASGPLTATITEASSPNDGTAYEVVVSGMTGPGTVVAKVKAGAATFTSDSSPTPASVSDDNSVTYSGACMSFPATIAAGDVDNLKLAILCANASPTDEVINLTAGSTYTLTDFSGDPSHVVGLPDITDNGLLTINGNGATITRSSDPDTPKFRIFTVINDYDNDTDYPVLTRALVLNNLTLSNGKLSGDANDGGALLNEGRTELNNVIISGSSVEASGGGIYSNSPLTLTNSTISGNSAGDSGGGIYNVDSLTITDSTISGNHADSAGSGIYNVADLTMTGSTLSGNNGPQGAAFYNSDHATLANSTISENSGSAAVYNEWGLTLVNATVAGNANGGVYSNDSNIGLVLKNTILANNGSADCSNDGGIVTGYSANLIGDSSCAPTGGTTLNSDPMLDALADNGGPTQTMALETGSPAIDAATECAYDTDSDNPLTGMIETDQRGVSRPLGPDCDLGAYEAPAPPTVTVEQAATQLDPTAAASIDFTVTFSAPVTGFDDPATDVDLTASTAPGTLVATITLVGSDNLTFTVNVTGMTGLGTVIVNVPEGAATFVDDSSDTPASISVDNSVVYSDDCASDMTVLSGDVAGLIHAVDCANALPSDDTINLPIGRLFTLDTVGLPSIANNGSLTLHGNNSTITRSSADGTPEFRLVNILDDAVVAIDHLTLTNGQVGITNRGTLALSDSTVSENHGIVGAGINNFGTMTLTGSIVSHNETLTLPDARFDLGGGIYNSGTLTLTGSTVSENTAAPGNEGGSRGGGIYNEGTLTLTGSTVSHNTAVSTGVDNLGGGIYNTGTLSVTNSTIAENSGVATAIYATSDSGPISLVFSTLTGDGTSGSDISADASNTITVKNSIAGSVDCRNGGSPYQFLGMNAITNNSCNPFDNSISVLPLGPLADNGGPTQTVALQPLDAEIDRATDCTDLDSHDVTTDQRGVARPVDGDNDGTANCDIGAYEAPEVLTVTVEQAATQSDPTSTASIDFTVTFSKPVTGFDDPATDVDLTGSTAPGPLSATITPVGGNNLTFTVTVTGMTDLGNVIVSLPEGAATSADDGAKSQASTSIDNSVVYSADCASAMTVANGDVAGLIHAVDCANALPSDDTITLATNGLYTLDTVGLPNVENNGSLMLHGSGATITRSDADGTPEFGLVNILTDAAVVIDHVTLTNGRTFGGGAISNRGTLTLTDSTVSDNVGGVGAGIDNFGTMTLTRTTVSHNETLLASRVGLAGGIYNSGMLTLTNSTVSENTAAPGSEGSSRGGGIYNEGTVTLANSTVSQNMAVSTDDDNLGGGIYNVGTLTMTGSTLSSNTGRKGAALYNNSDATFANSTVSDNNGSPALYNDLNLTLVNTTVGGNHDDGVYNTSVLVLKNTILSGSRGNDCSNDSGTVTGYGTNLIGDTSCTPTGGTTLNADPLLDSLADNGGPTQTMALETGSPAIDAATECTYDTDSDNPLTGTVTTDQRGTARPTDGDGDGTANCDLGAYEASAKFGVTINQADTQDDPTSSDEIHFTVVFSEPVDSFADPFDQLDIKLTNSDPLDTVGAIAAVITPDLPNDGTTYDVKIVGLSPTSYGTIVVTVKAGATTFISNGQPTPASTSTDNAVDYTADCSSAMSPLNSAKLLHALGCANFLSSDDTITLDGNTTYSYSTSYPVPPLDPVIHGYNVTPKIIDNGTLTIDGNGATIDRDGSVPLRLFYVDHATLRLNNITLSNGYAQVTGDGGAVYNDGGTVTISRSTLSGSQASGGGRGGAIFNDGGALNLTDSTVSGSNIDGSGSAGGGLYNNGTATIVGSTFSANTATDNATAAGIYNRTGTLTVVNSTFNGNTVSGEDGKGGALYNVATAVLIHTTISDNTTAEHAGGGVYNTATLVLKNSLLYDNSGDDCHSEVTVNGYGVNLIGDSSCAPDGGSVVSDNPELGPLANNGGPTQTMALLTGSPAIDAATECTLDTSSTYSALSGSVTTDQRGRERPVDGNLDSNAVCDLGAFEMSEPPTVTVDQTVNQADPTNAQPVEFTVVFSAPVTDFDDADDIDLSASTAPGTLTASITPDGSDGTTYLVDVSGMTGDGDVIAKIPLGVAVDEDNTLNVASTSTDNTVHYDMTAPTITNVTSDKADGTYTTGEVINVQVTFSEPVTVNGLVELALDTGAAPEEATYDSGSGTDTLTFVYTVQDGDTSPDLDYVNDTSLTASDFNDIADAAGNGADLTLPLPGETGSLGDNKALVIDTMAPVPVITSSSPDPTNINPIPFQVDFGEDVTGFEEGDITVGNGTVDAGSLTDEGSGVYSFTVDPTDQGTVTVDIDAAVAQDGAGNNNEAATEYSLTYDSEGPTPLLDSSAVTPTNETPIPFTVDFLESVDGFDENGITVGNGSVTASSLVDHGNGQYSFTVTPTDQGAVTVSIAFGAAQDAAGNFNESSNEVNIVYDSIGPTPDLRYEAADPTNMSPLTFYVDFDEDVSGFDEGDISVTNGSVVTNSLTGSGKNYSFQVAPTDDGEVNVSINYGAAQDAAQNDSESAGPVDVTYDDSGPTPEISASESDPTNASPIHMTIDFHETVVGFDLGQLSIDNGSADTVSLSGGTDGLYTFTITPADQGTVTVKLADTQVQDEAGNYNNESNAFQIDYDSSAPKPVISSSAGTATDVAPIPVEVNFGETVTGFTESDISVSGGSVTVSSLTGGINGDYTFTITPSGQGTITVNIAGGVVTDTAGNDNEAADEFSIDYDTGKPTPVIDSTTVGPTNENPFEVTVNFGEPVEGFELTDIVVVHGTATDLNLVDEATGLYSFNLNPNHDGTVTVDIAADAATDLAGNGSNAATQYSIVYDSIEPSPFINLEDSDPTNASPIHFSVDFGEKVTGFTESDISVSNGSVKSGSLSAQGTNGDYSFTVTPAGQGTVTVSINGGAAQDLAGNSSDGTGDTNVVYDSIGPEPDITTTATDPTNVSPIPFEIDFHEDVDGFDLSSLTITNGTADTGSLTGGTDGDYFFTVTPDDEGQVTVEIEGATVTDKAGNDNGFATKSIGYDSIAPKPVISSDASPATNDGQFAVRVDFGENVTGFTLSDITVGNGARSNFNPEGSGVFTFVVTPGSEGDVTIDIDAGVAQDDAGNDNVAADQLRITYDITTPKPILSSTLSVLTNQSSIPMTVDFGEAVLDFTESDISVGNGSVDAGSLSGGTDGQYTFDVTPSIDGEVTVNIVQAVAQDAAGNYNEAATQFSIDYDGTAPKPVIESTASDPTNSAPIHLTINFGEDVSGFDQSDIHVSGGSPSIPTGGANGLYDVDITPSGDGTITVDIDAGAAQDDAANPSEAADQFSIKYDSTAPKPALTSTLSTLTNQTTIPMTVDFGETVTGFTESDITVGNGSIVAASLSGGTNGVYTFSVTPGIDGDVTVDIGAVVAQDEAGNDNEAATQFSIKYDGTAPKPVISSTATSPTNVSPIPMTVDFGEDVIGFDLAEDVIVGNGSVSNLSGGTDGVYTFDVTPSTNDTVTVNIGAGKVTDDAGNDNVAANEFSIDYDSVNPSVTLSTTAIDPTNVSPIPVTVHFSKPVDDFESGDISATNATVGDFSGSGTDYSYTLTPLSDDTVETSIDADVAHDSADNGNSASNTLSLKYDSTGPAVTVEKSPGQDDPALEAPIHFTVTFDEPVADFDSGDITLSGAAGATSANVTESAPNDGTTYDVEVSGMTDNGAVTVGIAAGVAHDVAGNGNSAATDATVTFAPVVPVVTGIVRVDANPTTADTAHYTVSFSEDVDGVDATDFDLTTSGLSGTSIDDVSGSSSSYTVTVSTGSGHGTLRLDLVDDDSIEDIDANSLGGTGSGNGNFEGQVYKVGPTSGGSSSSSGGQKHTDNSRQPNISVENFLCVNQEAQTSGSIRVSPGSASLNGLNGSIYCALLALDGNVGSNGPAIGDASVLAQGVIQAVNLYGLLPGGTPTDDFTEPVQVCLRGSGTVLWLHFNPATQQREVTPLPATQDGDMLCVTVPSAGIVVLVGTPPSAPSPAATDAPTQPPTNTLNCPVTTLYQARLRADASADSAVLDTVPYNVTLTAAAAKDGWIQVTFGSEQGWISADLLSKDASCGG